MRRWLHFLRTACGFGGWRPVLRILCSLCIRAVLLVDSGCSKTASPGSTDPVSVPQVSVATAIGSNVPVELRAVGHVSSFASIAIRSQVSGFLDGAHFKEGAMVKAGDLLFTINDRPFAQALARARGDLEKELGLQKQAAIEEQENAVLLKSNIISKDNYNESAAYADSLRAAVAADQAIVDSAELELSYCQIRSPIDGRAGFVQISPGNVVQLGEMVLVTINQTQPIFVDFPVSEEALPDVRSCAGSARLEIQAAAGHQQNWWTGELMTIDNTVDVNTQTILLRARFPNQNEALWPGQTVNVHLRLQTLTRAALIPAEAVQKGPQGEYVFVVNGNAIVECRPIEIGTQVGDQVAICKGLSVGERVVIHGQRQLGPGTKVRGL